MIGCTLAHNWTFPTFGATLFRSDGRSYTYVGEFSRLLSHASHLVASRWLTSVQNLHCLPPLTNEASSDAFLLLPHISHTLIPSGLWKVQFPHSHVGVEIVSLAEALGATGSGSPDVGTAGMAAAVLLLDGRVSSSGTDQVCCDDSEPLDWSRLRELPKLPLLPDVTVTVAPPIPMPVLLRSTLGLVARLRMLSSS